MIHKYVIGLMLLFISIYSLAEDIHTKTYKDEIPVLAGLLGEHSTVQFSHFEQSINKDNKPWSTTYTKAEKTLDTSSWGINRFDFFMKKHSGLIGRLTYGHNKVYKVDVIVEIIEDNPDDRYPYEVISSKNQIEFFREDLITYLNKNGWKRDAISQNEYQKDNVILKFSHTVDWAIRLELTTLSLINEFNEINDKKDNEVQSNEYVKKIYNEFITIDNE